MNVVKAIYQQEQGRKSWRNYKIALGRLKCHSNDEFRGILPSTEGPDFNPEPPVFACTFCTTPKNEHLLALANEDGKIAIQDTNLSSNHSPFEGHQAHHNAIFDVAWAPGEMRLVSASGDHTAVLWDVQEFGKLQEVARFHAHTRSVKTVTFPQEEKMIFASGARDGVIMLWDTRTQKNQLAIRPDNFICNSHSAPGTPGNSSGSRNRRNKTTPSRASSITGLVFQDSHTLISCGAGDGKIKVWDVRKSYSTYRREPQPKYCMSTPNGSGRSGFTCLALDPGGHKLYASCMDNTIYCYNVATYEELPVVLFKGHKNGTFYVKACLSPDGHYLLSGSSDEQAYIWDTYTQQGENMPIMKLVGHGAEVTSVAWCPVGEVKIVTCSDDARHCLWRVGDEFRGENYQVELHGWAEEVSNEPPKVVPSTPVTPATPSFTSWRRWTPCIQRTPDGEMGLVNSTCDMCHQLSTPCLRCIAMRAPLPVSAPHGSKKRLEVLWEEDGNCPECERENRSVLNQVTSNADAPARRLFSPTKRRASDESGTASVNISGETPSKKQAKSQSSPLKRHASNSESLESSAKNLFSSDDIVALRRTSPRKRHQSSQSDTPEKRVKFNDKAGSSKSVDMGSLCGPAASTSAVQLPLPCSPRKSIQSSTCEDKNILVRVPSPKKISGTPVKRRISGRHTDSPHKRHLPCDDLQGISKIDDIVPAHSRPRSFCARHSKMGFSSPTMNLPNYVLDGTSPHHRCSPVQNHKENVDWLTRLRRERTSTEKRQELDLTSDQEGPSQSSGSRKTGQTTPGKLVPNKITPAKSVVTRTTPAKGLPRRVTPAKATSSRTTPGKASTSLSGSSTPSQSSQSGRKSTSRRSSTADAAGSSNSRGAATSLLRFFRVSDKPFEQQRSAVSAPSKTVTPVVL